MRQHQKIAVILQLMDEMWKRHSWCGETHIQKSAFFLQELTNVPLGYEFVLYRFGPFSFDLSYLIAEMNSARSIELVPQKGYRPKIKVTERGVRFYSEYDHNIDQYEAKINFVAERLKNKGVGELERIATGYFVTKELEGGVDTVQKRSNRLVELKPHVESSAAVSAINEVDQIIRSARDEFQV